MDVTDPESSQPSSIYLANKKLNNIDKILIVTR